MLRARKGRGIWEDFTEGSVLCTDLKMNRSSPRIKVGRWRLALVTQQINSKFHLYSICKLLFMECLFLNSIC